MSDERRAFRNRIFLSYWLPPALTMGLIYYLSTTRNAIPSSYYRHQDKFYHMVVYAFLSFLWTRAWYKDVIGHRCMGFLFAVSLATLWGIGMEICQRYCGRSFEYFDMLANFIGALTGAVLAHYIFSKTSGEPKNSDKGDTHGS